MFEKVSKYHPDKICDRIAGAMLDLAYAKKENPKVAIEVLIGHGHCYIINETDTHLEKKAVKEIVHRIAQEKVKVHYNEVKQDFILAANQEIELRCGDNGIFKGSPITQEQKRLCKIVKKLEEVYPYDGKYIIDDHDLIICQSHAKTANLKGFFPKAVINPLGEWTGGTNVDSGATNRKLGSDMGNAVTGGGICGKDLSKADVSINIYAHILAQKAKTDVFLKCAIGDKFVDGKRYEEIVEIARNYVMKVCGGFEAFAEHGLVWDY